MKSTKEIQGNGKQEIWNLSANESDTQMFVPFLKPLSATEAENKAAQSTGKQWRLLSEAPWLLGEIHDHFIFKTYHKMPRSKEIRCYTEILVHVQNIQLGEKLLTPGTISLEKQDHYQREIPSTHTVILSTPTSG